MHDAQVVRQYHQAVKLAEKAGFTIDCDNYGDVISLNKKGVESPYFQSLNDVLNYLRGYLSSKEL